MSAQICVTCGREIRPTGGLLGPLWVHVEATLDEALDVLAHIVSQANVNPVMDKSGEWVARYDMPVGSIHKAIPFLQRHGVFVDQYGAISKSRHTAEPEPRGMES